MTKKLFAVLFGLVILLGVASYAKADCSKCNPTTEDCSTLMDTCKCKQGYTKVDGVCKKCDGKDVCCGIKLNTDVPFIGKCISLNSQDSSSEITEENAFPILIAGLTKILMTVILIVCFLVLVVAGVIWTTGNAKKGKELITGVAIALALLGSSGVILRLVNPNFFG